MHAESAVWLSTLLVVPMLLAGNPPTIATPSDRIAGRSAARAIR